MGVTPSVTLALVDSTPYRLRYLMTATGQPGFTTLPNALGVTPDLRTDAQAGALSSVGSGAPLLEVLGIAVADQAGARRLLLGDVVASAAPLLPGGLHARAKITPRNRGGLVGWAVDADEGAAAGDPASAGFGVYVIDPPTNAAGGEEAYLDIHLSHSEISSE